MAQGSLTLHGVSLFDGVFDSASMIDGFDQGCGTVFKVTPEFDLRTRR